MKIADFETMIAARVDGGSNTVATERLLWESLKNEVFKIMEVKEIDVNLTLYPTFFTDNFDGTGKGINDYDGFAICNSQNGTRDRRKRASIGYDPDNAPYNVIGATGGEEKHQLTMSEIPSHHFTLSGINENTSGSSGHNTLGREGAGGINTNTLGGDQSHNNMQPYIVTLFIQRIS